MTRADDISARSLINVVRRRQAGLSFMGAYQVGLYQRELNTSRSYAVIRHLGLTPDCF